MKQHKIWPQLFNDQSGVTAVLVAVLLIPLLSFVALAVDISLCAVSKNELQDAADAAALAGARKLGKIYQGDDTPGAVVEAMSYEKQQVYECDAQATYTADGANDCEQIMATARSAATLNRVFGSAIVDAHVEIGDFKADTGTFTPGNSKPTAVFVNVQRSSSMNGPIPTFIAKVMGINTMSVEAKATASLTGQGKTGEGELRLPIGIPKTKVTGDPDTWCGKEIKLSPAGRDDGDVCGGWTDFGTDSSINKNSIGPFLKEKLSPPLTANDSVVGFTNGVITSLFDSLLVRFQSDPNGFDVDANGKARVDADGKPVGSGVDLSSTSIGPAVVLRDNKGKPLTYDCATGKCTQFDHRWDTSVIVYDATTCTPNDNYQILGFVHIRVKEVSKDPSLTVKANIICNYVSSEESRGGGGSYGTLGSIPGLVQPQNASYASHP